MNHLSPSQYTETGSKKLVELGAALREDSTGRSWRYQRAGEAQDRGKLMVAATVDAQRIDLSIAVANAIGDKKVKVTIGTGNAAANDYQDGWFVLQDGLGEGRAYPIEGHSAITASTAGFFLLKEPLDTVSAITVANVDLIKNFYDNTVISVADQNDLVAGYPTVSQASAAYGWVQTYGPCSIWFDEIVANGHALTIGTGTVGQTEMLDAAGEPLIGNVAGTASVDTEYQLVDLTIRY